MYPDKFNNKTNGITQRRFLLHGNPLLASWVTAHIGDGWITDLSQLSKLKVYADDKKAQQEFMNIKYQNKVRLSKYVLGGRTKGNLWSEAVSEQIFYLVLKQMQEIIEFWDKTPANGKL